MHRLARLSGHFLTPESRSTHVDDHDNCLLGSGSDAAGKSSTAPAASVEFDAEAWRVPLQRLRAWKLSQAGASVEAAAAAAAPAASVPSGGGSNEARPRRAALQLKRVLIANRSVAAIRIAHAAEELGIETVAVFDPEEDAGALHRRLCKHAVALPSRGECAAASPYLDAGALITAAKKSGADCVHPGYGFLSESGDFAQQCAAAGLTFVGPPAKALEIFGDKTAAKALASSLQPPVPTLTGSVEAFVSAEAALDFVKQHGLSERAWMLKAAKGGGGRGMRRIPRGTSSDDFLAAFKVAYSEAAGAFGAGGVFVEELLERCRHIEVQVLASASGEVAHLFERDCSVQLARGSKVVEVCPAVALHPEVRQRLLADAVRLIAATPDGYVNLCTVEFLVEEPEGPGSIGRHAFIEVNPRLQVEHGVTEEACGVDLVRAQFRLADGAGLRESLDLADSSSDGAFGLLPPPTSCALEVRVCLSAPPQGPISHYREPGGRGIRIDSAMHAGFRPSGQYDPMLALVIGSDRNMEAALVRTARAIDGFDIGGVSMNLELLREVLRSEEVRKGSALTTTTTWSEASDALPGHVLEPLEPLILQSNDGARALTDAAGPGALQDEQSDCIIRSSLGGLLRWEVAEGEHVRSGQTVAVVLAMKLETPIRAPAAGKISLRAGDGVEVRPGELLAELALVGAGEEEVGASACAAEPEVEPEDTGKWAKVVAERARRGSLALQMGGAEVLARRPHGQLNVRDRIMATIDAGSFREVGPVAGKVSDDGGMAPANFVLGTGRIFGRPVVIGGEDFSIAGGSPNLGGGQKSVFTETLALRLRIPLVRLHEGGGGAVGEKRKAVLKPAPTSAQIVESTRFGTVSGCLGVLPVVSAALGSVAGLPASRLVASHFVLAVRSSQILIAGPRVAEAAVGRRLSKEDLGGQAVHEGSGVVHNYVPTEAEAFCQIRAFLSYLPSNVDALPPVVQSSDPADRTEEELLTLVPEDRGPYNMRRLIQLVVDRDNSAIGAESLGNGSSFFEMGTGRFGEEIITGLARLAGYPVGIFANDPHHLNGAMTSAAAVKTQRLIELCTTFHLPIVTFVDQPGFMIGLDAEKAGTIRQGTAAVLAAQSAPVPWCTVQVRKAYGVAAAAHYGPNAHVLLWPSAEQGVLPVEAGVAVMYRKELEAAPPGERRRLERELIKEHMKRLNPWPSVENFGAQDLIDPRETRQHICEWAETAQLRLPALLGPSTFPYRCL